MNREEQTRIGRHVLAACACAVALRALFAFVPVDAFQNPDSLAFRDLTRSLLESGRLAYVDQGAPGVELHAFRSLLYPVFLAPFFAGGTFFPALFVQAGLGVAIVALLALLGARAFGARAGIVTAWIGASYFGSIVIERQVTTEALFTPLLAGAGFVAASARTRRAALVAGALFGAAALVRPAGLFAGIAVALAIALVRGRGVRHPGRRGPAPLAAFVLAGLALALAPALVRNTLRVGSPVLLTSGGMNFWIGNGRGTVGEAWTVMAREAPARGEVGADRWFYADTRAHAGEILRGAPGLLAAKVTMFLSPLPRGLWDLSWRLLFPLAAIGWWWTRAPQDPRAAAIVLAIVLSQVALALATVPWARYRAPLEPFLWTWAAAAIAGLWDDRRAGRPLVVGLVVLNVLSLAVQAWWAGSRS